MQWWTAPSKTPAIAEARVSIAGVTVPRPQTSSIPDAPGAYLFRDGDGRVIYAGKASSLRKRLASYWGKPLHPRTEAMVESAAVASSGSSPRPRSTR